MELNINDCIFKTEIENDFIITIEMESDCTIDDGYTFEIVANSFYLNVTQAEILKNELCKFINHNTNPGINCDPGKSSQNAE